MSARKADRWSLANVLRQVRGAQGATERANIHYAKSADIDFRLHIVRRALRDAEKQLRFCVRDALALRRGSRSKARRAA